MPPEMADAAQTKKAAPSRKHLKKAPAAKMKPAGIQPDDDEDVGHPRSFPIAMFANQSLRAAAPQSPVRGAAILGRASSHANC
eukprot:9470555-Alexandrium_andersonii.AAC.1